MKATRPQMDWEKSGSSDWLRSVMERFQSPLLRYAASLTGNLERARDVVQDTFLRLWERPPAQLNRRLAEWLFTVCRNRALDVRRKEGRLAAFSDEDLEAKAGDGISPCDALARSEMNSALLRLVATLPPRQQEVIRLRFHAGLSYEEISRAANLSVSNVGYLLHAALTTLRTRMRDLEKKS